MVSHGHFEITFSGEEGRAFRQEIIKINYTGKKSGMFKREFKNKAVYCYKNVIVVL